MKLVIFICVSVFAATQAISLSEFQKAKAKEFHEACLKETGVDPELTVKAKAGEFTEDDKLKQQILCFNKKAQFQESDGSINKERITMVINSVLNNMDVTKSYVDKCCVDQGSPENTAFHMAKCLYETHKM